MNLLSNSTVDASPHKEKSLLLLAFEYVYLKFNYDNSLIFLWRLSNYSKSFYSSVALGVDSYDYTTIAGFGVDYSTSIVIAVLGVDC